MPWIVLALALFLLAAHLLDWQRITIDGTTLVLLAILLVTPFIEQVRRIRVGEFEAEIAPREVDKFKAEASRRLGIEGSKEAIPPESKTVGEGIPDLLDRDHVLALAKLRMELESRLNRLYSSTVEKAKQRRALGYSRLIGTLVQSGALPGQLSGTIREVFYLCNRAIHGEYVRPEDARSIAGIGMQVLEQLDSIIGEVALKPVETATISTDELQAYMDGKYRVTTIVPLVEKPYRSVRVLDQEGLDSLLQGYDECAEFLVSIEKMDS